MRSRFAFVRVARMDHMWADVSIVQRVPRPAEPPSGRQLHDLGRALRPHRRDRRRHVPGAAAPHVSHDLVLRAEYRQHAGLARVVRSQVQGDGPRGPGVGSPRWAFPEVRPCRRDLQDGVAVAARGRRRRAHRQSRIASDPPAQYVTRPARCVQASKTSSAPSHGTCTTGAARSSSGFASSS